MYIFEPVRPHIIYQVLSYLKSDNKFYEDISIAKGLSSEDIVEVFWYCSNSRKSECLTEKIVSDKKEMTENIYDRSEIEFASVEDPLNVHTTASNETTLVSEIPYTINEEKYYNCTGAKKRFEVINFVNSKHFYIFFLRVNLTIMVLEIF